MKSVQNITGTPLSGKYNFALDITKFVCALFVIMIHTRPFAGYSDILDFYTVNVIARIAVPLFYAISGYLFFSKLRYQDGKIAKCTENRAILLKYLKRTSFIYIGWSVVYIIFQLPQWYRTGWWGKALVKDCIASFLFKGSYYHLWYLLALLYGLPVLYFLLSFFSARNVRILFPILWLIECLLYSYSWIGLDRIPALSWLTGHFPIFFDAAFRAVPLLGVGLLCIQNTKRPPKLYFYTLLSVFACVAEASILHFCTTNDGRYSYIFFTPIVAYFVLNILLYVQPRGNAWLGRVCRKSSLVIYCLHPLILQSFKLLGVNSEMTLWILVTLSSVFIAVFWVVAKGWVQKGVKLR